MPENTYKVNKVASLHKQLDAICDTGFALAAHIRYTRPSLLFQTYARKWSEHYSEKGYMLSDPVVLWGFTHTGRVLWDSLADQDPDGVLAAARAHGLFNGWTYAVGPATSRTISGFTRSGPAFTDQESADIEAMVDEVHALTEGFDQLDTKTQDAMRALG